MGSLTQVVNGEYIGADKYVIEDAGDGKSTVVFSPDNVLKEGTPVGAELLNEIQKNGLYYLAGTHRVDGQESIYDCTLIGIDTFDFTQLNVLFKPDTKPTQSTIKLNISGEVYTINGNIGEEQIGIVLVKSNYTAYTWANKTIVINDLTTGGATNALAAQQGVILNNKFNDYYNKAGVDEKFKNFCPYQVGDIYLTTNSTNPSSTFLGTTWQKIEGRFLLGTSGSGASKATGGSNSKTIAQANLPNVKLTVNSFSLSRGTQNITGYIDKVRVRLNNDFGAGGAFSGSLSTLSGDANSGSAYTTKYDFDASKTWTGSTNSVSPQTSALGSGSALDITPAYYTVHMWLRLT